MQNRLSFHSNEAYLDSSKLIPVYFTDASHGNPLTVKIGYIENISKEGEIVRVTVMEVYLHLVPMKISIHVVDRKK